MQIHEEVVIPLSKTKISLLLLGSVAFVLLGLWLLLFTPEIKHPLFGNKTALIIAALLAIVFFGTTAVINLIKLVQRTPGLVIGRDGIYDNSSAVTAGLIKWEDLQDIGVMEIQKQKLLMLYVQNPHEYISSQKNAIKRKIMQINYKTYSTPISISTNGLQCKFDELHALLKQYLDLARL